MKKLLLFIILFPLFAFGQTTPTIKQVLSAGNNASGKSLIGTALIGLNGATSGTVSIAPPAIITTYTFTLPANDGTSGQFLQTDGSGVTSWQTSSGGWALDGNTVGSEKWIGTADNFDFPIRTNNTEVARFKSGGGLGINTSGSIGTNKLYIVGSATGNNALVSFYNNASTNLFELRESGVLGLGIVNNSYRLNIKEMSVYGEHWEMDNSLAGGITWTGGVCATGGAGVTAPAGAWYVRNTGVTYFSIESAGNINIGNGAASANGRLHVKGSGSTSATTTSLFENSSGTDALQIKDDLNSFFYGRCEFKQGTDIASSSTITVTSGNVFELTGTTTVNFITVTDWVEGAELTLIANENVTINDDAGGGNLRLAGNANFSMTADDILTLTYSSTTAGGVIWREKSRSVN